MRLLLAEDEAELSRALCAILSHNHYAVDAVYDGQDALDYLLNGNYDGAILDIMMPKLDGLSVLRRVREQGVMLPILMLTAKGEVSDRVAGLDAGADDYLTKPFAGSELLARIRAMTRRQPELSGTVLRFGDLSLNRTTFELAGPDGGFRLAGKEFQMMEMLMQNPGQLISGELFLEKIWGFEGDVEINVVWVYLSYLRKKLTALGSGVRIKAVRNSGYLLEDKP